MINNNYVCYNSPYDINKADDYNQATGTGNTCDTTNNWNDVNATGCTYTCS